MKILVVDDHRIVRQALCSLLAADGHEVSEAADGATAVQVAATASPDVVLMDLRLPPGIDGLEATRQIVRANPACKVLILSGYADADVMNRATVSGAAGCMHKCVGLDELRAAIATVAAGKPYTPRALLDIGMSNLASPPPPLSPRETQVLALIADGLATKEIATALGISVKTAETHRRQIMDKLNIDSIAGLTKYALRTGLTQLNLRSAETR